MKATQTSVFLLMTHMQFEKKMEAEVGYMGYSGTKEMEMQLLQKLISPYSIKPGVHHYKTFQ